MLTQLPGSPDVRRAILCGSCTTSGKVPEWKRKRFHEAIVEKLSQDDMISLAADIASLKP
jgi:hypothetical protein